MNKAIPCTSKGKRFPDVSSIPSYASSPSTSASEDKAKFEYDDASPTEYNIAASGGDLSKYGYEDCSPSEEIASKYEYGEGPIGSPTVSPGTPRKSSMKHGEDNTRRPRRASIGYSGEIQVNLPGKREPVRRRTSISFCEEAEVNEVIPVKSLTDEPEALWFQNEEYSIIRTKARSLIHAVESGEAATKRYCIRGLEGHFGEGAESKAISRGTGWDAVLTEQYMQQNEGSFDDEGISMMYRLSSTESKIEAVRRATQDESEVVHYQRDTRRSMRRMSM
jgi:hypothetical protein